MEPSTISVPMDAEELEEAQSIPKSEAEESAESLLRTSRHGTLSTISVLAGGWPFGSVVPYAVSRTGAPIILIARIAEHTKNIMADNRVSLLVHESGEEGDIQARARLTVLGRAFPVLGRDIPDTRARYLARVPTAEGYFATHDFAFYRIQVERLRYIGGFGKIFWLEQGGPLKTMDLGPPPPSAEAIIRHMNDDHKESLKLYCRAFRGVDPGEVSMVGVDEWGFDVECQAPSVRLRFDFDQAATPESIRGLVIEMTERARRVLADPGP